MKIQTFDIVVPKKMLLQIKSSRVFLYFLQTNSFSITLINNTDIMKDPNGFITLTYLLKIKEHLKQNA